MPVSCVNAFKFVFKEKNWFVKLLIGALLVFFVKVIALSMDILHSDALPHLEKLFASDGYSGPIALILLYFGAIILIALAVFAHSCTLGYVITTIRRYMRAEEDIIPDWDAVIGKLFRRGFKYFMAGFVYLLALYIFGVSAKFAALTALPAAPFIAMLIALVALFLIVYALFMMPALLMSFCEQDKLLSALNVVRARQLMLKSIGKYTLTQIGLFSIFLFTVFISAVFFRTTVGIVILPFVVFYMSIVQGNLIAQYYVNYCKE